MRPNRFAIHNFFAVALSLAATLLLTATAHAQTEWFVDNDASDGGDGLDWPTAFNNLQQALDEAEESVGSDLIKVAQGTYVPTVPYCPDCDPGEITDRHITFLLDFVGVTIKGGYKGCPDEVCENPDDRDIDLYETVLSGEIGPAGGGAGGHPACGPGAGPCSQVDGTPGCEHVECCNLVCDEFPPCCDDNWNSGCVELAANLCTLPTYHVVTADGVNASVRLNGLTITGGFADGNFDFGLGAGMFIRDASPVVIRCTFSGNSAPAHGGGAIHIEGTSHPTVVNTSFIGNLADEGGAIHTEFGDAGGTFVNCLFSGNSAVSHGGAIDAGVGSGAVLELINCTLAGNSVSAPLGNEGGGAIYTHVLGLLPITNCILWGNLSANQPDQIHDDNGLAAVTYSDIEGGWPCPEGIPVCRNINDDPLFVDPNGPDNMPGTEDDNYRLLVDSPCIDKGNNDVVPCDAFDVDDDGDNCINNPEPTPDLDLNDRIVYGGQVPGPMVDMGAYEYCIPEPCPWDLNGSCDVGILDLLALLAAWGPNPGDPADFDGDGIVGILDLLTLLANWGACPGLCPCVPITSEEPPLEEVLTAVGLSMDDWDLLQEILHSGNNEAIDNALCWFGYYINGCDGGTRQACSDHDPFTDCVGDLNGDCCVDKNDAQILLNQTGPCPAGPGACLGDLNGDCVVNQFDHRDLLDHFGACPGTQFCPSVPPGCGTTTTEGLEEAVTLMGFSGVPDYQAHISATSEGEAFVCACVLQVLLEAQP